MDKITLMDKIAFMDKNWLYRHIYIAQNFMTQKVIKLNLFLISKKGNVYIALNIYVSEDEIYVAP